MTRARQARIALYSHDTMGLGHMRRNLLLAQTLSTSALNAVVLMVAGAREAAAFAMPAGVDCLTLPALSKSGNGHYGCRHMPIQLQELIALRAGAIQAALEAFDPDILIVDNVPRGAVRELDSALEALRAAGRARLVLGLRDVLDEPSAVHAEWSRAANEEALREYYHLVCVYGDRLVCDPAEEYGFSPDVAAIVRFAGYLDQRTRLMERDGPGQDVLERLALPPGRLVLGLVGGGQDGTRLAEAFSRVELPPDTNAVLVTGPFMPAHVRHAVLRRLEHAPRCRVLEFVQEPMCLLKRADRVVAMGGYGTTTEILALEKHALIVPRVKPRREQLIRAERLAALGLVHVLLPDEATPQRISAWLARDLGDPPKARSRLDFGGLGRMPALLADLLERERPPLSNAIGGCAVQEPDHPAVGYVVKRYPRYSETFIVTEILAHEEAGLPVEVFALRPPCDTHFQPEIARVRAPVTYLPSEGIRALDFWKVLQQVAARTPRLWSALAAAGHAEVRDVWQAALLAQHVFDRRLRHLHAHFATASASVARLAASMAGITYSLTAHAKDIYGPDVVAGDLRQKLADASAAITVSDYNLQFLRSTYGVAAVTTRRVYNGLPLDEFPYSSPAVRGPRILGVGRLVEKKGFPDLVDACAILARAGREFRCDIIGAGPLEAPLRERIAAAGLSDRVHLPGPLPRPDVAGYLHQSAVFAAPCMISSDGDRDGLPTVLLEAMALGTPVVATDVTGIPELVRHESTGLIVGQQDPPQLASALGRLLTDAELRVRLAQTARALVAERFDVRRNAREIRDLFAHAAATTLVQEAI